MRQSPEEEEELPSSEQKQLRLLRTLELAPARNNQPSPGFFFSFFKLPRPYRTDGSRNGCKVTLATPPKKIPRPLLLKHFAWRF